MSLHHPTWWLKKCFYVLLLCLLTVEALVFRVGYL